MTDYDQVLKAFAGCDALVHMAAIPAPFSHPDHEVHNNNVVGSYNALRAAVENGIMRICQASSVNAIGLSFSRAAHFDYFPLDEKHPNYSEEPYGLSKWICEAQADTFARRYEDIRIASMRFHLVIDSREKAGSYFNFLTPEAAKHLWAYTLYDAAARACLMSLEADYKGHEVFYIVAPDTTFDMPTKRPRGPVLPRRARSPATSAATGASSRRPRPSGCWAGSTTAEAEQAFATVCRSSRALRLRTISDDEWFGKSLPRAGFPLSGRRATSSGVSFSMRRCSEGSPSAALGPSST